MFANSVGPDAMLQPVAFHLDFTVCKSTRLGGLGLSISVSEDFFICLLTV